jgi:very-short-patch-repair endonuclease/endogenous inhibitor of DNA gyrase (YacG/DUF329 family)
MGRTPGPQITTTCNKCGKVFIFPAWRKTRKYCSRKCSNAPGEYASNWQGGGKKSICINCGKIFIQENYLNKKLCSHSCQNGSYGANWQGGNINRICQYCGKVFYAKKSDNYRRKYCSKLCHNNARVKRTPVPCPTCGTIRQIRDSDIKRRRYFCDTHCYRLHRPTSIELTIRNKLTDLGIEFIPEYKIGRWSIDIYIPSASLAIECDGSYWHKITKNGDRDIRKDNYLINNNIQVIRFPEEEIRNNLDHCIHFIQSKLNTS